MDTSGIDVFIRDSFDIYNNVYMYDNLKIKKIALKIDL